MNPHRPRESDEEPPQARVGDVDDDAAAYADDPQGQLERSRCARVRAKTYPSEIFTAEEVVALVSACPNTPSGLRLRAYIAVLYRTGMEASEGLSLRYRNLDLTVGHETVRVPASRLKRRILALDEFAVAILNDWLVVRRRLPGDHVFCTIRGKTSGNAWAAPETRRELRDLGREVLGKRVNAGAFRTTLTAELIIEQWPLPYIQTQLGVQGIWSFREIFPKLGIGGAPQAEVAEVARTRPAWGPGPSR